MPQVAGLGSPGQGEKTQSTGGKCCCLHQEGFKVVPGVTDGVGGDIVREIDPDGAAVHDDSQGIPESQLPCITWVPAATRWQGMLLPVQCACF